MLKARLNAGLFYAQHRTKTIFTVASRALKCAMGHGQAAKIRSANGAALPVFCVHIWVVDVDKLIADID